MKDTFGREINYLRISVTDRCNLRCKYCMPVDGCEILEHDEILTFEEIEKITRAFVNLGVNKVRITGGEPLVRPHIIDLLTNIGKIKGITDFAITTNGILLEKYAQQLLDAGITRLNISLDTLNEDKFNEVTINGGFAKVLKGIEVCSKMGFEAIKLNVVLMGGINDDEIEDFVNITKTNNIDVRFIELMPLGEATKFPKERFLEVEKVLEICPELTETFIEDKSSPAVYYKMPDGLGKVGLIKPMTCKFCKDCNRVRLTSTGGLKLCLHHDEEIDLKWAVRNNENLEEVILKGILEKPEEHKLNEEIYSTKSMIQIGG